MKKMLVPLAILLLISIFVGTRLIQRQPMTTLVHELDLESVSRSTKSLVEGYLDSRQNPLHLGEIMPILELPILRGSEPDWSQTTLLTIGSAFSSSAQALHHQLTELNIQKIHVVDRGRDLETHIDNFPDNVIFLDGTDKQIIDVTSRPSRQVQEIFGVYKAVSAYFFNSERLILGAWVNGGGPPFEKFGEGILTYVNDGVQTWTRQNLLPIGQSLDLSLFPPDVRAEIEEELKAITVVFVSEPSTCSICETFLSDADPYLENWRQDGYGLILIESGHANFSHKRLSNGVLRITDRPLDSHGESVASTWGVTTIPGTFILQNGKVTGEVVWQELTVERGQHRAQYRDLMFRAINEIVASDFVNY